MRGRLVDRAVIAGLSLAVVFLMVRTGSIEDKKASTHDSLEPQLKSRRGTSANLSALRVQLTQALAMARRTSLSQEQSEKRIAKLEQLLSRLEQRPGSRDEDDVYDPETQAEASRQLRMERYAELDGLHLLEETNPSWSKGEEVVEALEKVEGLTSYSVDCKSTRCVIDAEFSAAEFGKGRASFIDVVLRRQPCGFHVPGSELGLTSPNRVRAHLVCPPRYLEASYMEPDPEPQTTP